MDDQTGKINDHPPGPESSSDVYTERNASDTMATSSLSPIRGSNGYQQQIPIDPAAPLELSVSNASGEIRLHASDQQNVWVVVRRVDGHVEDDDEVGITIDVAGNAISIHPDWQIMSGLSGLARRIKSQLKDGFNPDDWNVSKLKLNPNLEYDIRVEVPRALAEGSRISLKTASGKVTADGVRAALSVATASGSVALQELEGRVATHTASGKVTVADVKGSLEINTASGSIGVERGEAWVALRSMSGSVRIGQFVMKNARVTTVSGSIHGDVIMNNTASYDFESVSGSVKLQAALPANGGASLAFRSLSGSSHVDGDWVQGVGKRIWELPTKAAGPAIRVKTVSGSLSITGRTTPDVELRDEPLPVEPETDWADEEARHAGQPGMEDAESHIHEARAAQERAMSDMDQHWDKAMGWVKEATRRIQEATDVLGQPGAARPEQPAGPERPAQPVPPTPPAPPPTPQATEPIRPAQPSAAPPMEPTDTVPFTARDTTETAEARRLRLLEAVERGEIDIDEALAQMDDDSPDSSART